MIFIRTSNSPNRKRQTHRQTTVMIVAKPFQIHKFQFCHSLAQSYETFLKTTKHCLVYYSFQSGLNLPIELTKRSCRNSINIKYNWSRSQSDLLSTSLHETMNHVVLCFKDDRVVKFVSCRKTLFKQIIRTKQLFTFLKNYKNWKAL